MINVSTLVFSHKNYVCTSHIIFTTIWILVWFPKAYFASPKLFWTSDSHVCCQGFLAWLHLSACGVWSCFWPDGLRKMARKAAMAISLSGDGRPTLKKLTKVFRLSRGPFGSGKFGKQMGDSRSYLLSALKEGNFDPALIDSWLPGCARDQCKSPENFTVNDLITLLQKKEGQGGNNIIEWNIDLFPESRTQVLKRE